MANKLQISSCRHFTGVQNDVCEKGIKYSDIIVKDVSFGCRIPCIGNEDCGADLIECFEPYTQEEIEEHDRLLKEALAQHDKFNNRESEDCPHCNKHVDSLKQIGHCVYARPCGCRIHQGRVPVAWQSE